MADVATKTSSKPMSVVSSNGLGHNGPAGMTKTSLVDACGVQSNNGSCLIELELNNKLAGVGVVGNGGGDEDEDELLLMHANNTRNDKSLQELIESELALRICGPSELDSEDNEPELLPRQPEITKTILLEPRSSHEPDVNADFIVNEIQHYGLIGEEPYLYANGQLDQDQEEEEEEESTTTTSGPSLPSAFEAPADQPRDQQLRAHDQDEQQQENEEEDDEDSVKINELAPEQRPAPSDYEMALGNARASPISVKEAAGVDEKACSFYATEASDEGEDGWTAVKDATAAAPGPPATNNPDESLRSELFYSQESNFDNYLEKSRLEDESRRELAPIATPDEISDISNANDDSESREEVITTSSVVSTTTKKKKKIEGGTGGDASPNHTKTKKTKKSKKSELEKENISVKRKIKSKETKESMLTDSRHASSEMIEISGEDDLSNVNVKTLTQTYVSETNRVEAEKTSKEIIATGVSIKQLCRSFGDVSNMNEGERTTLGTSDINRFQEKTSFNKFDALTKKSATVLHVRSVDASKVQQQLNSVAQNGDANPTCRSCGKVVFQMEQTKAEGQVWHKNCFRCVQCSKQLNVDHYESHGATLYCKPHFKELFQPKPVEESDQPTSDKPDLGLEELSSLNVKSRFQVFEKANETTNDIERSPSQVAVKRSPSILSKLARFQAKGMDIGVADESLNGIPYEESSESDEEIEEEETEEVETETTIVKSKRGGRERPMSFTKMDDIKNRWETTSQQGRRESQREARKEEIAGIRSRLFMGKQGKMKEMYQQAVADSERVTKINAADEIQHTTNARSIKERFERGEPIAAASDEEQEGKLKGEKPDEEILAAGISRKSRSLFLELDATAAKTVRPVTPNGQTKAAMEAPKRARDAFMGRQVSEDVVRSTDTTEEVQVDCTDISNKFKFFETYREPEKMRRQFRITPPRDGQVKMDSPDREIYRDPEVVRAEDRQEEVVRTDTARKMLSIFRQMEEKATKEDLPDGPKPLKRFTPPPEDKFAKATASESDEDEEEAEESEDEEQNPNYVRASDKVEDDYLKQAQNAQKAKTLRAKFEQWDTTDGKTANHQHVAEMEYAQADGTQPSIESASSLRARFESMGSQPQETPRQPKVKVNRFVEIQTNCMDVCESCEKKVYPLEKVETNNKIFHKQCFRCLQCNCILRMDTFTLNNGKLYCIPHFKQLFITRGNYDEGFGVDPHKNKWASSGTPAPAPIAVRNGDV